MPENHVYIGGIENLQSPIYRETWLKLDTANSSHDRQYDRQYLARPVVAVMCHPFVVTSARPPRRRRRHLSTADAAVSHRAHPLHLKFGVKHL
jgi:hypothetical protein